MTDTRTRSVALRGYRIAAAIGAEAYALGLGPPAPSLQGDGSDQLTYDQVVDDDELRRTTRKLFLDGHYAMAVEEACKCLNNLVKDLTGLEALDGAGLMKKAFSRDHPVLRLNALGSRSEKAQQQGYMEIFSGVMTGVRNPRAHEHAYPDDPVTALELLTLANHLIRTARVAAS